eukprot:3985116-Pleurochrysis_carterae.AAC.1
MVSRIAFINLRSTESIISDGANMKRLDSSGVSGGGLGTVDVVIETEAEVAVVAGAALAPVSA